MKTQLFLVFAVLLTFVSCENDSSETQNPHTANFSFRNIPLKDVPGIDNYIPNKNALNDKIIEGSGELEKAIFYESAIELIDKDKNINYSASFIYEDTPENVYYNLIINKLASGGEAAYIFKYICNAEDFENYRKNYYNFRYFKGVTEMIRYKGKINGANFRNGDDEECPKIYIPSAHDLMGNVGASGGGGGTIANPGFNTTILGYNVSAGSSGTSSVSFGGTTYYAGGGSSGGIGGGGNPNGEPCNCYSPSGFGYNFVLEPNPHQARPVSSNKSREDCPETATPVGNVPINDAILIIKNIKRLLPTLRRQEMLWLTQHPDEAAKINTFLGYNPNEEKKDFILEMLNAIIEDDATILDTETFDEQIITELPPCVTQIVTDLQSLENGKFGEIIKKFAGKNPAPSNYEWKIIKGPMVNPEYAATTSPVILNSNPVAITTLNQDDINVSTELSLAKTIMHEAFHAYLVSVYKYRDIDQSYANLLNEYYDDFNYNANDTHHHVFAETTIISEIATALKEYGMLKGYNLTQQFCEDMAWGGLNETQAFLALPQSQRERILCTISAERKNSDVNILSIAPIGNSPCP